MQFARDMDAELADKIVGMYVNKWTLGYGEKGKQAVKVLIERALRLACCQPANGRIPQSRLTKEITQIFSSTS